MRFLSFLIAVVMASCIVTVIVSGMIMTVVYLINGLFFKMCISIFITTVGCCCARLLDIRTSKKIDERE